jgi:hypothetical protein
VTVDPRIKQYTDLARKIWPGAYVRHLERPIDSWEVLVPEEEDDVNNERWSMIVLKVSEHERAAEAFELALCGLAKEMPGWGTKLVDRWFKEARDWDEGSETRDTLQECAIDLRMAAKGEE